MKSFLYLSLFCTLALGLTIEFKLNKKPTSERRVPNILNSYQKKIKSHFKRPENANLLMSFLFGAKQGISPHTKAAFEKNNLSFLLTPSGIHLASFFLIIGFFLNRFLSKKKRKWTMIFILSAMLLLPTPANIKRLSLVRLGFHTKTFFKKKISSIQLLCIVFGISFLLGHYFNNPLSYLMSLLYIGTFFTLSEQSRMKVFLALFSNQILIALFLGNKISFFSVFTSVAGVTFFTFIQPLFILYFCTFWIYPSNWIEPVIQLFIRMLKISALSISGTFTSASVFLLIAVWILLFVKNSRSKLVLFAISFLIHTNTSMSPCLFSR
jgi:hypothetical protein